MAHSSFPRTCRLLTAQDYKSVFDSSEFKVSSRYFLVLATISTLSTARLGLIIAKKNVAKAVQRNRLKRQIRQSFRTSKASLNNLDLVVLARKDADKLENSAAAEQLNKLLSDLSVKLIRKQNAAQN